MVFYARGRVRVSMAVSAIGISQCIRNPSFLCPLFCHLMSCIFAISCIIFAYHVACAALQKV